MNTLIVVLIVIMEELIRSFRWTDELLFIGVEIMSVVH